MGDLSNLLRFTDLKWQCFLIFHPSLHSPPRTRMDQETILSILGVLEGKYLLCVEGGGVRPNGGCTVVISSLPVLSADFFTSHEQTGRLGHTEG